MVLKSNLSDYFDTQVRSKVSKYKGNVMLTVHDFSDVTPNK